MFFKDYKLAFRTPHDLSEVPFKAVKGSLDLHHSKAHQVEEDIVSFYNLVALVNHQIRGDYHVMTSRDADILRRVDELMEPILRRMINYLTVVCIRECRHYKKFPVKGASDNWNEAVSGVKGTSGFDCVEKVYATPDLNTMSLRELLEGASACFGSSYWGGAFGGKAWKTISDHTLKFVAGEISAEVFIDQAFSLQHNTTTVFNKSVIYKYDTVDNITTLLDMQAHGIIGLAFEAYDSGKCDATKKLMEEFYPEFLNPDLTGVDKPLLSKVPMIGVNLGAKSKTASPTHKALWTYQKLTEAEAKKMLTFMKSTLTITKKQRSAGNHAAKVQVLTSQ